MKDPRLKDFVSVQVNIKKLTVADFIRIENKKTNAAHRK